MQHLSQDQNQTIGGWIPKGSSPADDLHMSDDFARIYEFTANRVTGPIASQALRRVRPIGQQSRVLDIAAGAGALAIPAAFSGASVLAVDIAPGMVDRLSQRLAPFPAAHARLLDGQRLDLDSESFDVAFSIIGVSLFADWRAGLREMARVLRPGGQACIATWHRPPGGGPFMIVAQALRAVFPERMPPVPPEGFLALSDPMRLEAELAAVGLANATVTQIEAIWEGPAGPAYLEELHELHRTMAPYLALTDAEQRDVDRVILDIVAGLADGERVRLAAPVLIGIADKPL